MLLNTKKWAISLLFLLLPTLYSLGQSISGFVLNEDNEAVPLVNIYVRELQFGTTTDMEGRYYLDLDPGNYEFVFSAIGYETQNLSIVIGDDAMQKNVYLRSSNIELEELTVKASKRDPAYEIIQKAIDNKKKYLSSIKSSKSEVYVKATEDVDIEERKKRAKQEKAAKELAEELGEEDLSEDVFAKEKKTKTKKDKGKDKDKGKNKEKDEENAKEDAKEDNEEDAKGDDEEDNEGKKKKKGKNKKGAKEDSLSKMNMVEMQLTLNYQYPDKYKEERTAYKAYGSKHGLFIPLFSETDFNFYNNLVDMKGLVEVPVISPISRTAILVYKFKLEEAISEDDHLVYKIKVTPRRKGNAAVSGYIYINDGLWNINRLELNFDKGGLRFYDAFQLTQKYEKIEDTLWIPVRQSFKYETKAGRFKTFKGNTVLLYSDVQNNYEFPEKFFGNEIAITTQDAYKKDSSFWNLSRPEPLSKEEQRLVFEKDSLESIYNSTEYLDSIQADFNKVQFIEILWEGVGFRDVRKKSNLFIGPLLSLYSFDFVTGHRIGPFVSYSRRYENGKILRAFGNINMSLYGKEFQGNVRTWYRYNPHRLADVSVGLGHSIEAVFRDGAIVNFLNPKNYYLHDFLNVGHRFELFNGFYLGTSFEMHDRISADRLDRPKYLDDWGNQDIFEGTNLQVFEDYQAFITEIQATYTPKQQYMTEPTRKVVLGSRYPTFSLTYRKGWNRLFTSDIDFDYLEFAVNQNLTLGVLGASKYTFKTGQFFNTKDLRLIDIKRFQQSDPWLLSDPLKSFQLLDRAIETDDLFFEFHYIHHFNGLLVNTIPLIKKTRLRVVAGAGALWIPNMSFRQEELFAGLERSFKLGPRRRLRVGFYGIIGESNSNALKPQYKFSLDLIDTWKKEWSY